MSHRLDQIPLKECKHYHHTLSKEEGLELNIRANNSSTNNNINNNINNNRGHDLKLSQRDENLHSSPLLLYHNGTAQSGIKNDS